MAHHSSLPMEEHPPWPQAEHPSWTQTKQKKPQKAEAHPPGKNGVPQSFRVSFESPAPAYSAKAQSALLQASHPKAEPHSSPQAAKHPSAYPAHSAEPLQPSPNSPARPPHTDSSSSTGRTSRPPSHTRVASSAASTPNALHPENTKTCSAHSAAAAP